MEVNPSAALGETEPAQGSYRPLPRLTLAGAGSSAEQELAGRLPATEEQEKQGRAQL